MLNVYEKDRPLPVDPTRPRELRMQPRKRVFFHSVAALREQLQSVQERESEEKQEVQSAGLLEDGVYYQPYKRNQAAVDSFVPIVEEDLTTEIISTTVFMFQFTVSISHDVHTGGLNEVFSLFPEELADQLQYVFVFVVPDYVHASFRMGTLKDSQGKNALKEVHGRPRRVLYYKTALPFTGQGQSNATHAEDKMRAGQAGTSP